MPAAQMQKPLAEIFKALAQAPGSLHDLPLQRLALLREVPGTKASWACLFARGPRFWESQLEISHRKAHHVFFSFFSGGSWGSQISSHTLSLPAHRTTPEGQVALEGSRLMHWHPCTSVNSKRQRCRGPEFLNSSKALPDLFDAGSLQA